MSGLVNSMHIDHVLARGGQGQDSGRLGPPFVTQADAPVSDGEQAAPWVALSWDGGAAGVVEAGEMLAAVELADLGPMGRPSGPDYRLHWIDRIKPGLARLWPLPWPGRFDRAGWVTILVSWLLMLLLAALAVLIAILIWRNEPPQAPPDPTDATASSSSSGGGSPSPQSGSPSPQSGSPSPQSGSPSPQSGSPSPQSGSPGSEQPSQSPSMSGSASGSPSPSGSESGGGSPVPSDSGSPGAGDSPRSRL